MKDELKDIIKKLGSDFVSISIIFGKYNAAGIFKVGKNKKDRAQAVKYFEGTCPLEAAEKLAIALTQHKADNKKIYD